MTISTPVERHPVYQPLNRSAWFNYALGISLGLTVLTRFRVGGAIGLGEIGLLTLCAIALLDRVWHINVRDRPSPLALPLAALVFFVVLPLTFYSVSVGVTGSTTRDLLAYILCAALLFSISVNRRSIQQIAGSFVATITAIVAVQYYLGGSNAWYYGRYTAGAHNPNQLALHICAAITCLPLVKWPMVFRAAALVVLVIFGFLCGSDAFQAYAAAAVALCIAAVLAPKRLMLFVVPMVTALALLIAGSQLQDASSWAGEFWASADQGGARGYLYRHAIEAWASSPVSVIFGHGAGSYSGIYGPFQGAEAHSTPLDALTIAGIPGLIVMFIIPLFAILRLQMRGNAVYFALSLSFMIFTLFHYVGRHPVFWFVISAFLVVASTPRPERTR